MPGIAERILLGLSTFFFAASAAVTVVSCLRMSAMGGMEMPGGWTVSMMWMRLPGQSWPGAAGSFLGLWLVMMVAMMLPSLGPRLQQYLLGLPETNETQRGGIILWVAAGYFCIWTAAGLLVFPLGVTWAEMTMRIPLLARTAPMLGGFLIVLCGGLQFTEWKAYHLDCCRERPSSQLPTSSVSAWSHGLRLGLHCTACCANLTMILLVLGMMDWRAMALVTTAITLERLAPAGHRIARGLGFIAIAAGLCLIARAAGNGG